MHTGKYRLGWRACQAPWVAAPTDKQVYYRRLMAESTTLDRLLAELRADFARKGGKARAASLTPEERSDIARKAVKARWRKYRKQRRTG